MCEQYFLFLALMETFGLILIGFVDRAYFISRFFIEAACDLSMRGFRATLRLERTNFAISLMGAINDRIGFGEACSWRREPPQVSR